MENFVGFRRPVGVEFDVVPVHRAVGRHQQKRRACAAATWVRYLALLRGELEWALDSFSF